MQNREMNIKKRIVSALMALVMTLSLVNSAVITAFAEGTQSADPSTGETQNANEETQASKDYDLKIVDFEGDYWNALIDDPQYGGKLLYGEGGFGMETPYTWTDANTGLSHAFPKSNGAFGGTYCYWSYGHAISNYVREKSRRMAAISTSLLSIKRV